MVTSRIAAGAWGMWSPGSTRRGVLYRRGHDAQVPATLEDQRPARSSVRRPMTDGRTQRTPRKRRPGGSVGDTLGGIIVGFDQQILRNLPPPQELVQKGSPVRGLSGEDGTEFVVVFPGDAPEPPVAVEVPPIVTGEEGRANEADRARREDRG